MRPPGSVRIPQWWKRWLAMPESPLEQLVQIMHRLRAPDGCPWDREQTHDSLKEYLGEEAAELFDAIDDGDLAGMREELGDVLLQVVFHCQIAAESDHFDFNDVVRGLCEKLIRRHPHVFADRSVNDAAGVVPQWEAIKKTEKAGRGDGDPRPESSLDGVPRHLPALHRAHKIQRKAAKVGFDWPTVDGVIDKIDEELAEVRQALAGGDDDAVAEEIGDLLFSVVNLSRFQNRIAEQLLHDTIRKFEKRFHRMERLLANAGQTPEDCTLEALDARWNQAKAEEQR